MEELGFEPRAVCFYGLMTAWVAGALSSQLPDPAWVYIIFHLTEGGDRYKQHFQVPNDSLSLALLILPRIFSEAPFPTPSGSWDPQRMGPDFISWWPPVLRTRHSINSFGPSVQEAVLEKRSLTNSRSLRSNLRLKVAESYPSPGASRWGFHSDQAWHSQ